MEKGTRYRQAAVAITIGAGWVVGIIALASGDFSHPERANYQTGLAGVALTILAAMLYGFVCRWLDNRAAACSDDGAVEIGAAPKSTPRVPLDQTAQERVVKSILRSWNDHERVQMLCWLEENLIDLSTAQMHRLFVAAVDATGDARAARLWLQTPISALGGKIPALYAKESTDAFEEVAALLARIGAGEYSV